MKSKLYYLGIISAILILSGGIFKMNHFPGASIMLVIGILTLCFVFLPAALISSFKAEDKKRPLLYIAVFITIFIDFIGIMFKIMHWPGAGKLIYLGILSPIIIFLPVYLYYHFKSKEDSPASFQYIMFLLVYLSVMSSLLSLNVSKDFINSSLVSEYTVDLNDYFQSGLQKTSMTEKDILIVHEKTEELINKIQEIKWELAHFDDQEKKSDNPKEDKIDIFNIPHKDSQDIPGTVMIGKGKAVALKKMLEDYQNTIKKLVQSTNTGLDIEGLNLLKTDNILIEGKSISWEEYNFEHLPLILVLKNLTTIENNVILTNIEITYLLNKQVQTAKI